MMNYKLTCTDGYTKMVSAASKDEAVKMLMADPEVSGHVSANHPDMVGKSPEEMTAVVAGMVSEETAPASGGAM